MSDTAGKYSTDADSRESSPAGSYSAESYPVGKVARLSGVTVRTLHHYDEIGLLKPRGRTAAGYRSYSGGDLDRLRRILSYRELGFGLDDIANILADGDATAHLRRQHDLLTARIEQLQGMVAAVELELEASTMGINLSQEEKFELFGDFDPDEHAEEAQQRWGDTDAYKQSQRRVKSYTSDDWKRIKAEGSENERRLAEALREGVRPDSARAMDLAEEHREQITRWFYECTYEIHRGLAEMYVADDRFAAHYDGIVSGLAQYLHDAIRANADRADA